MGFSLVDRAREMRDGVVIQEVTVLFMRDEVNIVQCSARDFKNRVAKLVTDKEHFDAALLRLEKEVANLKKDKKNFDVAMEKFEKEVAELKRRENCTKKLAIDEFKLFSYVYFFKLIKINLSNGCNKNI